MGNGEAAPSGMTKTRAASVWRCAGYACNRTWICLLFFSSVLFRGIAPEQRWETSEMVYLVSVITLAAALLCAGAVHQRVTALLDARGGFLVGPMLCAAGIAPIALPSLGAALPGQLTVAVAGVGTGLGSALVLLDLGRAYRATDTRTCALETLIATAIAAAATMAVFLTPGAFYTPIVFALPFAAEACIKTASSITLAQAEERQTEPMGESIPGKLVAKFITAALILGVATGFMRDTYSVHSADAFDLGYATLFAIGAVVAVALFTLVITLGKRFSIKLLYKPVILVCVLGFVVAPSLGMGTSLPYLLVTIGYTVFEIVVWVTLCDAANRFQYTFVQVFGIGRGATLAIGVIAGSLLSRALSGSFAMSHSFLVLASGLAIGAIVFSYLYVFTENDLNLYDSELYGESPQTLLENNMAATSDGSARIGAATASGVEMGMSPGGYIRTGAVTSGVAGDAKVAKGDTTAGRVSGGAGAAGPAGVATRSGNANGNLRASVPDDLQRCRSCNAESCTQQRERGRVDGAAPAAAAPTKRKKPLLERCRIIGSYYGLSKREVDVFHLLSLGRTAARIQEELLISAGTVNTHTYHIYTKLDVHSQQQLIDLMQAADLDAMSAELAKREK